MEPAIKAKWLTALRSGRFVKGIAALSVEPGRFCCLGVLCELAKEDGIIDAYDPMSSIIQEERVLTWSALASTADRRNDVQCMLARLNDRYEGWNAAIAYIEENL